MKNNNRVLAVVLGSLLVSGSALAETSLLNQAGNAVNAVGQQLEVAGEKVDAYVDDSAVTAKVKKALFDVKDISSNDVSVSTAQGVVTLSGFVATPEQAAQAVLTASAVPGVVAISDKLHIKGEKEGTVKEFATDVAITSEVKAKLLAEKDMPSTSIHVETANGVVQLSGSVKNSDQLMRAERVAKEVKGVVTVKNDLSLKP